MQKFSTVSDVIENNPLTPDAAICIFDSTDFLTYNGKIKDMPNSIRQARYSQFELSGSCFRKGGFIFTKARIKTYE